MEVAPLLKLVSDGTPAAMAGVFLLLFLGLGKLYLDLQKQVMSLLRENIDTLNRMTASNEKLLRLLGSNGNGRE